MTQVRSSCPGNPDESLVYTLAAHLETPKMPPNKPKIPQREIDLIRRWIEGGLFGREDPTAPPQRLLVSQPSRTAVPCGCARPYPDLGSKGSYGRPASVAIDPVPRPTAITALAVSPKSPLVAVSGRHAGCLIPLDRKMQSAEPHFTALPISRRRRVRFTLFA